MQALTAKRTSSSIFTASGAQHVAHAVTARACFLMSCQEYRQKVCSVARAVVHVPASFLQRKQHHGRRVHRCWIYRVVDMVYLRISENLRPLALV